MFWQETNFCDIQQDECKILEKFINTEMGSGEVGWARSRILIAHSRNCKQSGTSKGLWDRLGRIVLGWTSC